MVQYRGGDRFDDKNFWKLEGRPPLWQYASDEINRPRVEASRRQRGLIDYRLCSTSELEESCHARGLLSHGKYQHPEMGLQDILEQADDEPVFRNFQDLPPELRVRVFEWHQVWLPFGHTGEFTRPPPIAQVNWVIREEALSVFFRERVFFVDHYFTLEQVTHDFFAKAPLAFLRHVKKLNIMSTIGVTSIGPPTGYAEWSIDLSRKASEEKTVFVSLGSAYRKPYEQEFLDSADDMLVALRTFVDNLIVERKGVGFEREDAEIIRDALLQGAYGEEPFDE